MLAKLPQPTGATQISAGRLQRRDVHQARRRLLELGAAAAAGAVVSAAAARSSICLRRRLASYAVRLSC